MIVKFNLPSVTSWKTSLAGLISFAVGVLQIYNGASNGLPWKTVAENPVMLLAVLSGVGLMLAKDGNVTGGSIGQPSTPKALAEANQAPAVGVNAPKP